MKHTTEELLFALKIRKLAIEGRNHDLPEELEGTALRQWKMANPVKNWVIPAIEEVEFVADIIKSRQT